jgi:SOS response regulatory protein OraA/RecX
MILKLAKKLDPKAAYKNERKALMTLNRKLMQKGFEADAVRSVLGASAVD